MLRLITDEVFSLKSNEIIELLSIISNNVGSNLADSLVISENSNDYSYTFTLKAKNGKTLSQHVINLPIESSVVNLSFKEDTKTLVFTLRNGNTLTVPLESIIQGLATSSDLQKEKSERQEADKKMQSLIESEVTARENAVRNVETKVSNEATARDLAIKKLQASIDALPFFVGEDGFVYGKE